jgi:hypothetical protein
MGKTATKVFFGAYLSSDDPIKHPKSSTKNYHGKTLFWLKLGCLGQF